MPTDYRMPEYGSVRKVMPGSRDQNPLGAGDGPVYSSKPQDNYQSLTIEQPTSGVPQMSDNQREMMRRQEEEAFMAEERNYAQVNADAGGFMPT